MRQQYRILLGLLTAIAVTGCGGKGSPARPTEVIVSAAASLNDALKEAQSTFEPANPGLTIRFNFGSSGALQQQIEQGAPVDLFISAGQSQMNDLTARHLVDPAAVQTLASNQVVLVRPRSAGPVVKTWQDLKGPDVRRIALGNPDHVPAGQYGKAVLTSLGLWSAVEQRLVFAEDVRQVLNYAESGEVEAAIVYSTDAALSRKVEVVAPAPPGSHPPVVYPMAVLKEAAHPAEAGAFAKFLLSPRGREILQKYGFKVGG